MNETENNYYYKNINMEVTNSIDKKLYRGESFLLNPDSMKVPDNYTIFHNDKHRSLHLSAVYFPNVSTDKFIFKVLGREEEINFYFTPPKVLIPFPRIVTLQYLINFKISVPCILYGYWKGDI